MLTDFLPDHHWLVSSINEVELKRDKLKKSLEALMKEEKDAALTEIDVLKVQVQEQHDKFKAVANELNLGDINLDKLPGMLADLGYKETSYDLMHKELAQYLSQMKKVKTAESIIQSLKEVSKSIKQAEYDLKKAQGKGQEDELALEIKKMQQFSS